MLEHSDRYRTQASEYNGLFEFFRGVLAFVIVFYGAWFAGSAFGLLLLALCWLVANALQLAGMPADLSLDIASYLFIGLGLPILIWVLARIWLPTFVPLLRDTCFLTCAGSFTFGKAWALVRSVASVVVSDWRHLAGYLKRSDRIQFHQK